MEGILGCGHLERQGVWSQVWSKAELQKRSEAMKCAGLDWQGVGRCSLWVLPSLKCVGRSLLRVRPAGRVGERRADVYLSVGERD